MYILAACTGLGYSPVEFSFEMSLNEMTSTQVMVQYQMGVSDLVSGRV